MRQAIANYHLDEENHWVAELECGHNQHVRHQPPFINRPWVVSKTGRKVHNVIRAEMHFEGDKIIKHKDRFNTRLWAKQALGLKGALIGGTSFFKRSLQKQTNALLDKFESKQVG